MLGAEIVADGCVRLRGHELAETHIQAVRSQLYEEASVPSESIDAAIEDRFRFVRFYPKEWRVTLTADIHIVFDLGLAPVNVFVERWQDGLQVLSQAARMARLKAIFD